MKKFLILCLLLLSFPVFGQHLKRKFLGTYSGTIPAYKMHAGNSVIDVASAQISIELTDGQVIQQIGQSSRKGTWEITKTEKCCYYITLRLEGQLAEEQLVLTKKTRDILRRGLYPQPDARLEKL